MDPLRKLSAVTTADGRELALFQRGSTYFIKLAGQDLMSSLTHGSEEALARLAWDSIDPVKDPQVLIGGLGMGYTVRAMLDQLPSTAAVTVAEVFPEVVEWNRTTLGRVAGEPLADRRVRVAENDVYALLTKSAYHVIVLDVDNGPSPLTLKSNHRLYGYAGLARLRQALKPGGVAAIWSSWMDRRFLNSMRKVGFTSRSEMVRARACKKGARHWIFIGKR